MTVQSNVFSCTLEQATFVAECANLKHYVSENRVAGSFYPEQGRFELWADAQTYGGGARICWKGDIAWVSRHSGYAWADIVEDVCDIFREIGCKEALNSYIVFAACPAIYGEKGYREYARDIRFS
jgi:hypothetical protein